MHEISPQPKARPITTEPVTEEHARYALDDPDRKNLDEVREIREEVRQRVRGLFDEMEEEVAQRV